MEKVAIVNTHYSDTDGHTNLSRVKQLRYQAKEGD